jgi:hypothetical protein
VRNAAGTVNGHDAHAVTNAALGAWVVRTGNWSFW